MKTKSLLPITMLLCIVSVFGQKLPIDLTFSAINKTVYVKLDSIKVKNRTQGDSAKVYWPDTTLTITITPGDLLLYIGYSKGNPIGIQEIDTEKDQFQLFQNYPNPIKDKSLISMYIPEHGKVSLMVNDIQGRVIVSNDQQMDKGIHFFRFSPGNGSLYFLMARWNGMTQSIKIINAEPNTGKRCMLDYAGRTNEKPPLKASSFKSDLIMQESGILDTPNTNKIYTFQFATNIPCIGTPTVTYEGQTYNTIQIFSQCWLKENLNVGTMIPGSQEMTDNGILEKYCYNNEPNSCTNYGGLYQWWEMIQYTTQQGVQGICPPGWHLPTDEEWKVLEGAVDSQYGIGDNTWDGSGCRGIDDGTNLKTTSGWYVNGNGTNLYGFSGLPGGDRGDSGYFGGVGVSGLWWTSTECDGTDAWYRYLGYDLPGVGRGSYGKAYGFSMRCLRDN